MPWPAIALRGLASRSRRLTCSNRPGGGVVRSIACTTQRYAARALLGLKRLDSSRHSGVIALFQEHFVKTGIVSPDIARALPQAVAMADTSYAPVAGAATVQVAASVIVTAILTPLLTSWWYKKVTNESVTKEREALS